MKKAILLTLIALMPFIANAQSGKIQQRLEIVESDRYEVFDLPTDGQHHYYLSVGTVGFGNDYVQVELDPVFELFIPLGNSLTESIETLEQLKELCKQPRRTTQQVIGCLALAFPNDNLETITITHRRFLLWHRLEFSVDRDGYQRVTYVPRSSIKTLLTGVKFYRKLHPKES